VIRISTFEAEIDEDADIFIGPSHRSSSLPALYVILPSFSFKVHLNDGHLESLRRGLEDFGTIE
jgi:hypothetical protein